LKTITGGDPIPASFKGRDMFSYIPQFKIWISSNFPPKTTVDDNAAWGRFVVFYWPHSHLGKEDTSLRTRFQSPDFLEGVLVWCVEGATEWYKNGLRIPETSEKRKQEARDKFDTVSKWLGDNVVKGPEHCIPVSTAYQDYSAWCRENGVDPKGAP